MTTIDKAWAALGRAIAGNASTKQVNALAAQLDRVRGSQRDR